MKYKYSLMPKFSLVKAWKMPGFSLLQVHLKIHDKFMAIRVKHKQRVGDTPLYKGQS